MLGSIRHRAGWGLGMKIVVSAFIALGLLTSAAAIAERVRLTPKADVAPRAPSADGSTRFRLTGQDTACLVTREPPAENGSARLTVAKDCDGILPGLSAAGAWTEDADGNVSFAAAGRTLAQFGVADGVAYESFQPARPPMMLSALD